MCVFVPEARLVNKRGPESCLSGKHHWPAAATLRVNKVTNRERERERVRARARAREKERKRERETKTTRNKSIIGDHRHSNSSTWS